MSNRGARAWALVGLVLSLLLSVLLSACETTTSTTTSTTGSDRGATAAPTRNSNEPPDNDRRARVRLELASAYFSRGQNDVALDNVNEAIAAKPDMAEAYNLRGLVYGSLGETRLAEESFQRALRLKPQEADAMHNYGWFLCQQRRFPEADLQFQSALAQPQYRDPVRTLLAEGVCQARAGRLDEAERTLMRSYEMAPSNPAPAVNLAEVLYKTGDFTRARFYIRRVNSQVELSNAQTLWLEARIENRLGNQVGVNELSRQLRARFPQAPETLAMERGRFDD